jgi:hypothetical protein
MSTQKQRTMEPADLPREPEELTAEQALAADGGGYNFTPAWPSKVDVRSDTTSETSNHTNSDLAFWGQLG